MREGLSNLQGWVNHSLIAHAAPINLSIDIENYSRFGGDNAWWQILWAVLQLLLMITATSAFFGLAYVGIKYIMAGSSTEEAEKAKKQLTWVITGLIITMLALVLVTWINSLLHGTLDTNGAGSQWQKEVK